MPLFSYTGSVQTWIVPNGVRSISIDMLGGRGGNSDRGRVGGFGGRVYVSRLPVVPGSTLYIYVGGEGIRNYGGWNGGGISNWNTNRTGIQGGGGGGASDIRIGGIDLANRVMVAGGGGGGGGDDANGAWGGAGGAGGGLIALNGSNGNTGAPGGGGGTQTTGGSGITYGNSESTPGSLGLGGTWTGRWDNIGSGGGGGGGYFGGGAGSGYSRTPQDDGGGGGGGGSSYASVPAVHTHGYNGGAGSITIEVIDHDIGIRYCFGGVTYGVACAPSGGGDRFRVCKNSITYRLQLVNTTDSSASHIRVNDNGIIKSLVKIAL